MYAKIMSLLIRKPAEAIALAKKERDINLAATLLVVEWLLFGIGTAIIFNKASAFLAVLVGGIVVTLFSGLLAQIVFSILGSKGNYADGLATLTYSLFPLSFGFLISSILLLLSYPGILAALVVAAVYAVMSLSTLYRTAKEFFKVDMITAWIGIGILVAGAIVAVYIVALGYYATLGFSLSKALMPTIV